MKILTSYLSTLTPVDQVAFAMRCGTTVGYLRKAASIGQKLGYVLCLRIAAESHGAIRPEDLRDDVDWDYLRAALANTAQEVNPMQSLLERGLAKANKQLAADPANTMAKMIKSNREDALAELATAPVNTARPAIETIAQGV